MNRIQKSPRRGVSGIRPPTGAFARQGRICRSAAAAVAFSGTLLLACAGAPAVAGQDGTAFEAAYCTRVVMAYEANPSSTNVPHKQLAATLGYWRKALAASVIDSTNRQTMILAGALGATDVEQCNEDIREMVHQCAPDVSEAACVRENMVYVRAHDPISCQHLRANNCLHPR